jgi:ABC-type polysaccharide/polyol phosphate transport system ATPase subunit
MIRLGNIRKVYPTRFGEKLVLDGIGLELAMGERLGVLGRNGAGKSTMIRLISGAERPTSGSIERHMSVSWPLAFGGAFQNALTGQDNVRFISRIYGQDFKSNGFRRGFCRTRALHSRAGAGLLFRHARAARLRDLNDHRV